jgi:hypothetical protein
MPGAATIGGAARGTHPGQPPLPHPVSEEAERQADQIRAVPPKQRIYRVIAIGVRVDGRRHDIRPGDVPSHDHLGQHDNCVWQ